MRSSEWKSARDGGVIPLCTKKDCRGLDNLLFVMALLGVHQWLQQRSRCLVGL